MIANGRENILGNTKFALDLSMKGIVQADLLTVKINNINLYPIYFHFLTYKYKEGQVLRGKLEVKYNIKVGSSVIARGLGHATVDRIESGVAYFKGMEEPRAILSLHPVGLQAVVFKPEIILSNYNDNK